MFICTGEFKSGLRHGHGTSTSSNGFKYVGEHKENVKCGHGTFTTADSSMSYVGQFVDDIVHGHAVMTTAEGDWGGVYDGSMLIKLLVMFCLIT